MRNHLANQEIRVANFLVIGNKRSASSWLNVNLLEHPEIFMTSRGGKVLKGVNFFNRDYGKGVQFYAEYFKGAGNEKRLGEVEHSYFWDDLVPERIYKTLGVIPLLITLRQPVERAYSHFQRRRRDLPKGDHLSYDFETAFRMAIEEGLSEASWGYYGRQFKKYLEWFPVETFHIVRYEHVINKPVETLSQVYRFLDVNPDYVSSSINKTRTPATNVPVGTRNIVNKIWYSSRPVIFLRRGLRGVGFKNVTKYRPFSPPPLEIALKKKLTAEFFDEDIRLLSDISGNDFSSWLSESM